MGGWPHPVNTRMGVDNAGTYLLWELDPNTLRGQNQHGHAVALRPFFGYHGHAARPAGPALDRAAARDRRQPRLQGISRGQHAVPADCRGGGGLFSCGDGHARQGDGESAVTAIECPIEAADLRFELLPGMRLAAPRANTPAGWLTFGLHESLDEAALLALDGMVQLLGELHG